MNWNKLTSISQLDEIKKHSADNNVLLFKHSTRCSISSMALKRLERSWNNEEVGNVKLYYLDLVEYRDVSNEIQTQFKVIHESPQILLIKNEECIYDASHMEINFNDIKERLN